MPLPALPPVLAGIRAMVDAIWAGTARKPVEMSLTVDPDLFNSLVREGMHCSPELVYRVNGETRYDLKIGPMTCTLIECPERIRPTRPIRDLFPKDL